jgi:Holliday junction resolvase-like predicted endonuclease
MVNIASFIGGKEILCSGELIRRIQGSGIREDNARQAIRRHSNKDGLWRSTNLALPRNERLFAHQNYLGKNEFLTQVATILESPRPGIARLIQVISSERVLLRQRAEKLLAAFVGEKSQARFQTFEEEVEALEDLKAASLDGKDTALERLVQPEIAGSPQSHVMALKAHGQMLLELNLTTFIINHFRNQNLISWNGYSLPEESRGFVVFNNHAFGATGYSWLSPMLRENVSENGMPKPVPVVVDLYYPQCTKHDVESFIHRVNRAFKRRPEGRQIRRPVLGVIASPHFDQEAWGLAKKTNSLVINLQQLFGEEALKAMKQIADLLSGIQGDTDYIEDAQFQKLSDSIDLLRTNPYVVDLKSLSFEALAALVLRAEGWENVQLNVRVPFKETEREVDVSAQRDEYDRIHLVECKAETAGKELSSEHVNKFFTETVVAFIKNKLKDRRPEICHAEIWTTGKIGKDAEEALQNIFHKKYMKFKLLGLSDLIDRLPRSIRSCARLLNTIASC